MSKDYCDLCGDEMYNYYLFTWDFEPTFSNIYVLKDDTKTISICSDCKKNVKLKLFDAMKRKEDPESGINGTIKYT